MRIRTWAIGIFILGGFALFTAILFFIGSRQNVFNKHFILYTEFTNLSGLESGAKVRVSGLDAGEIKKLEIPTSPSEKFRLELEIKEQAHGLVRKDSLASIETAGVVGDKFILVSKGSSGSEKAPDNWTVKSKEPLDITAVMEKGTALLDDVHGSIQDIKGRVDLALDSMTTTVNHADGLIGEVRPKIRSVATQVNLLLADVNAGKGAAGLLLKDSATRQQVQETVQNVTEASANIDQISRQANQLVTDFQSRQFGERMQKTLDSAQSLSQALDDGVRKALAQDAIGQEGAVNIRNTLTNLNRSTANLAEDTEALKHNFFFRGFFRKRGFYSLEQLTREDYEEAERKAKGNLERKWFGAATLFMTTTDGKEQLSAQGTQAIDEALGPYLDRLASSVVIVEGYAIAGTPDVQYVLSRARAELVRHYLENRYHVYHSNIAAVAMRGEPLPQTGRSSWDGAAIAFVSRRK